MEATGFRIIRLPCSVCQTKNKICSKNCEFAAYFPNEVSIKYESANGVFGTSNIIRMMKLVDDDHKHLLASSILIEGEAMGRRSSSRWLWNVAESLVEDCTTPKPS
ncbi:unnamed protein product [Cochlearia groenlandica]